MEAFPNTLGTQIKGQKFPVGVKYNHTHSSLAARPFPAINSTPEFTNTWGWGAFY